MVFQFNTKKVFLTYAQCGDTSKEDFANFILTLEPLYYVVAREQHADGGYHLHAIVGFESTFRSRDERVFDFNGLHPNFTSVKSLKSVIAYVKKEGDWLDFGPVPEDRDVKRSSKELWAALLESPDQETFMSDARRLFPKEWVLQNAQMVAYALCYYNTPETYAPEHTQFEEHPELDSWVKDVLEIVSNCCSSSILNRHPPVRYLNSC